MYGDPVQDAVLQALMLYQLRSILDAEVEWQNHLTFLSIARGDAVKEVRDLASGMKEAIANVKKMSLDAKSALNAEVANATVNAKKVAAMAADLRTANKEVEAFLGDSNSNFPTGETSDTQQLSGTDGTAPAHADRNGVVLNADLPKG